MPREAVQCLPSSPGIPHPQQRKGAEHSRAVCADKAGPTATTFRLQKRLHRSFPWNIPTAAARQEPGVQGEGSGCGRGSRPQKQMACLAPSPERRGHPGNHLEPEIKEPEAPSFSESVSSHWVAWCFLPSKTELALLPFPNGSGGLDLLSLCLSACEVEPSLPPPTSDGTAGKGATDMQPESLGSGSVLPTACS